MVSQLSATINTLNYNDFFLICIEILIQGLVFDWVNFVNFVTAIFESFFYVKFHGKYTAMKFSKNYALFGKNRKLT